MSLLNDTEKIAVLIKTLERHLKNLPSEKSIGYYLESILGFLKTEDTFLQKAAFSNAELFIDSLVYEMSNQITLKRAIGALVASIDKLGFYEPMDAAALILEFEEFLKTMPLAEAERLCKERWEADGSNN